MGLKVQVIEDSAVFQKIISTVLKNIDGVDEVTVCGTGREGIDHAVKANPDVIFLDLHLPDMDGMDILQDFKKSGIKRRVVVVSGLSEEGADLTIKALSRGAQQFIRKPSGVGFTHSVAELRSELEPVIKTVTMQVGRGRPIAPRTSPQAPSQPARPARGGLPSPGSPGPARPHQTAGRSPATPAPALRRPTAGAPIPPATGFWVTAIAVSTGGPQALVSVIPKLPADYPVPIVIVQHMPPLFTQSLAKSLDAKSAITVVEAQEGMTLEAGKLYIAPGGQHLVIKNIDGKPVTALNEDPPEQSVRPSADVLFRSLAHYKHNQGVLSVVMTGMGEDGLAGVRALKLKNCHCLTQSEDTCVVYGMPRAVDVAGLSDEKIPLEDLASRMTQLVSASPARIGV